MRNVLASLLHTNPRPARRGLVWSAAIASVLTLVLLAAGTLPTFLGYDAFVLAGGSKTPAIREHAILVARRVDPLTVRPGDVITFRLPQNPDLPVTHRVVGVRTVDDIPVFRTKGDANANIDPEEVSGALPISKMAYSVPLAGFVVGFAQTIAGKIVLIALPLMLLVGLWFQSIRARLQQRQGTVEAASPPIAMAPPEPIWEALRPAVGADIPPRFPPGRGMEAPARAPLVAVDRYATDSPSDAVPTRALSLAACGRPHLQMRLAAAL